MAEIADPAMPVAAHCVRVWGACVLSDEDPAGHAAWAGEMVEAEKALAAIIPTTIEGAVALLGVVRLRTKACVPDEFDNTLLANVEAGLLKLSAAWPDRRWPRDHRLSHRNRSRMSISVRCRPKYLQSICRV